MPAPIRHSLNCHSAHLFARRLSPVARRPFTTPTPPYVLPFFTMTTITSSKTWLQHPSDALEQLAFTNPPRLSPRPPALASPSLYFNMGQVPESVAGPYGSVDRKRFLLEASDTLLDGLGDVVDNAGPAVGTQAGSARHFEEICFLDTPEGRQARQSTADQHIYSVIVCGETVPIQVEEREGFVPAGCALVTLRFLPAEWRTSGAIAAVLASAGYRDLEIQEFGVPKRRADGGRHTTVFRNDVQVAIVRTPSDDPTLAQLPRRFDYNGGFCKLSVQCKRPSHHPRPVGGTTAVNAPPAAGGQAPAPSARRIRRRQRARARETRAAATGDDPSPSSRPAEPMRLSPGAAPSPPSPASAPPPTSILRRRPATFATPTFTAPTRATLPSPSAPTTCTSPASPPTTTLRHRHASSTTPTFTTMTRATVPPSVPAASPTPSPPPPPAYVPPHRKRTAEPVANGQSPDQWGHAGFTPSTLLCRQGWTPGEPLGPRRGCRPRPALVTALDAVADLHGRLGRGDRRGVGSQPCPVADSMDVDVTLPDDPLSGACMLWLEDNLVSGAVSPDCRQAAVRDAYVQDIQLWQQHAGASRPTEVPEALRDALRAAMAARTGDPDCVAHDLPPVLDEQAAVNTPDPPAIRRYPRRARQPCQAYWLGAGSQ